MSLSTATVHKSSAWTCDKESTWIHPSIPFDPRHLTRINGNVKGLREIDIGFLVPIQLLKTPTVEAGQSDSTREDTTEAYGGASSEGHTVREHTGSEHTIQ
jgi:hypothetical protein